MFFPGCECLGQLSSWWELALLPVLGQGCADLLQLRGKTALQLECAFSCTEKVDSNPKLRVKVWKDVSFLLLTRFPACLE